MHRRNGVCAGAAVWALGAIATVVVACGDAPGHDRHDARPHASRDAGADAAGGEGGGGGGAGGTAGSGGSCQPSGACSVPGCNGAGGLPPGTSLSGVWISPTLEVWAVGGGGFVGRRDPANGAWCWCAPAPSASLRAIWGTGNDLFIASDSGSVLHFDGAQWTSQLVTGLRLTAIHGTARDNVWVVASRRVAQPDLTALPPGGELEPAERVDGHGVDDDAADVAARDLGLVPAQQRADAVAEPGQILPGDRAPDREVHYQLDRFCPGNSSGPPTDEFCGSPESNR